MKIENIGIIFFKASGQHLKKKEKGNKLGNIFVNRLSCYIQIGHFVFVNSKTKLNLNILVIKTSAVLF